MGLTLTYTTTSSDTPVTISGQSVSQLQSNFPSNVDLKTIKLTGKSELRTDSFQSLFCTCNQVHLIQADFTGLDTSNITSMESMFSNCYVLQSLDLTGFDTTTINSMKLMFNNCRLLTILNLDSFEITHVKNIQGMFQGCESLKTVYLKNFKFEAPYPYLNSCFLDCYELTTIYCSHDWREGTAPYDSFMFSGCRKLIGAVQYDSSRITSEMANPTTGYFTYWEPPVTEANIYINEIKVSKVYYNEIEISHVYLDEQQIY